MDNVQHKWSISARVLTNNSTPAVQYKGHNEEWKLMLQDNFIPGMGTLKHLCKFPQQKLQNSITKFCDSLQLKHEASNEKTAWYYTITIES